MRPNPNELLRLRREAWQTSNNVRIRFVPVPRNRTASTAARLVKAPVRLWSWIAIAATRGARVTSKPAKNHRIKREALSGASFLLLLVMPAPCPLSRQTQEPSGESWSRTFVFVLKENKRLLPFLITDAREPVFEVVFRVFHSSQT
jgi:hypothetical protein